jgi:hypothetical protein
MNDFLQDLFQACGKNRPSQLADYDDDDLNNFFGQPVDDPKRVLTALAAVVLECLDDQTAIVDAAVRVGLAPKSTEKLVAFVKKHQSDLLALKIARYMSNEETLDRFDWSVRSVFFSKKDEFKGQKKYAVLNFDVESVGGLDKLKLNCSRDNIEKIRNKLNNLDESIREIFESS